jgi:hypothetical protein
LGNKHVTYLSALKSFVNMRQGQNESNDSLLKCAKSMVETLSLAGGDHVLYSPQFSDARSPNYLTEDERKLEIDKFCAVHLLAAADPHRYKDLNEELLNASYVGRDEYPTTPSSAYELLVQRSGRFQSITRAGDRSRVRTDGNHRHHSSVGFLQTDICQPATDLVPGRDGTTIDLECYYCHAHGHTSNNCPKLNPNRIRAPRNSGRGSGGSRGANMMQLIFGFQQSAETALIPKSWVLLDTCSTSSVSNNKENVGDIRKCSPEECLQMFSNGGSIFYDEMAPLKLLPLDVHFNAESVATILSVKDVANIEGVHITMDTSKE